jgi:hypothetical protein
LAHIVVQCINAGRVKLEIDESDAVATPFARNPMGFLPWHG